MILKTPLSILSLSVSFSTDLPQLIPLSPSHLHNTKTLLLENTSMDIEAGTLNKQVILVSTKNI